MSSLTNSLSSSVVDLFKSDLDFIYMNLKENHPGIHDKINLKFRYDLEDRYSLASKTLIEMADLVDDVAKKIIVVFTRSFLDAHLWVQYDSRSISKSTPSTDRFFEIKESEKFFWVSIPTFNLVSAEQKGNFRFFIQKLNRLEGKPIIFDVRGNGGGNSYYAEEIIYAVFGKNLASSKINNIRKDVVVDWRISESNLAYIEGLVSDIGSRFGTDHDSYKWISEVYSGMIKARDLKMDYYSERESLIESSESCETKSYPKIFAIIDRGCGSACLDFLDYLKTIDPEIKFLGEKTYHDSVYMELREIRLPSDQGTLGFPIKVYRNRPRGHNIPHLPDISCNPADQSQIQTHVESLL